jgi:cytochrome c
MFKNFKTINFMRFKWRVIRVFFFAMISCFTALAQQNAPRVLVFSKTEGFRHTSIEAGKLAWQKMAKEKGFTVDLTEDANQFNPSNLKNYRAVVFLSTTGDVLNAAQQLSFEHYIQAGGGYLGIHAASDTEYDWAWYGRLVGAYFLSHPINNIQIGKFRVAMKNHPATKTMPDEFERKDEFYDFKQVSPTIKVLVKIDESSYKEGKMGENHPISWYQEFDGGRSFYTAMGHTDETFSETLFLDHIWAGLQYVMGGNNPKPLDYSRVRPDENRFTKVTLAEKLDEPMELTLLDENRVLFIERKGAVRLYNLQTKELKTIATIPVSTKTQSKDGKISEAEDGLLGLNKDPNFKQNQWIYLYYAAAGAEAKNILTRYQMRGDELLLDTKKVILEVPTQREECCHTGGSIVWDKAGNLYLSTGDNTNPHASNGFSPSDERPERSPWDAQKSSANTNDLRGKIIRIKPNADGTYTIPEGNLFPKGTPLTRPEIYTMGHRNPFRISVDQKTGFVYWGEVGPDASQAQDNRGSAGHDEVGQARQAGNFGWPHFVGDNKAYHQFDFATNQSSAKWDANKPINNSPNNTGLKELPPAQKAFIWYPYGESAEFPLVGSGGRNAMAGPVFYSADFAKAPRAFPKYYDGKLLIYEWMRGWIMAVEMDKEGNFQSMDRFMPSYRFSNPMDMEFATNGDLYMLEYGSGWFTQNEDARLIRIEYNGGNRKPNIQASTDKKGGAIPFEVKLSANGTSDPDGDALTYSWKITSSNGFSKTIKEANPSITLTKSGNYTATLTVKDGKGESNTQSIELSAGNEPPVVSFEMEKGNKSFFFPNQAINYTVKVSDKEDGSLTAGTIKPEQVSLTIDYLAEGYDKVAIAQGHRSADANVMFAAGQLLIENNNCKACHSVDKKSVGPNYKEVALRYKNDPKALEHLTKKIINGGSGVWGEIPMAAQPKLSPEDAAKMVKYIMSLGEEKVNKSLPIKGSYTPKLAANDKGQGVFMIRVAYQDQGANGIAPTISEQNFTLRNPQISTHKFDSYQDVTKLTYSGMELTLPAKSGAYMGLSQIDLTSIRQIFLTVMAPKAQLNAQGGKVEIRLGSPEGKLIGESPMVEPTEQMTMGGTPLSIPIQATEGLQDVYLVFRNPKAQGTLMVVLGVLFKAEEATTAPSNNTVNTKVNADDYVGKYKMTGLPFEYIEITNKDGKVWSKSADGREGEIKPTDQADKFDANGQAFFKFIRDEKSKVIGVKLEAMGMSFEGKRE